MAKGDLITSVIDQMNDWVVDGGFEHDISIGLPFADPRGPLVISIKGNHAKRSMIVRFDETDVYAEVAHITISLQSLIDLDYPYLNEKREIALKGHVVGVSDGNDLSFDYVVLEIRPSNTLGLCLLTLGHYNKAKALQYGLQHELNGGTDN